VEVGDEVIRSGVGGVYPKGLRVGTITSVKAEREELLHTARVKPAVDFGRLEQVFVVLQRGPTMDLLFGGGDGDLPEPAPPKVADGRCDPRWRGCWSARSPCWCKAGSRTWRGA